MLDQRLTPRAFEIAEFGDPADEAAIDLDRLLAAVRRQLRVLVICAAVGAALGLSYAYSTQPLYTATSQILIDDRRVQAIEDVSALTTGDYDTVKVDSQVELLRSGKILLATIERLRLADDPLFAESKAPTIARIIASARSALDFRTWFATASGSSSVEQDDGTRALARKIYRGLTVSRVGRTYVLNISYTSADPKAAARLSNAVAEAYLVDQLDAKYDATRRASAWLQGRIQELREKSLATDLAVQKYRAENNLIAADGRLVGEQQLAELNSQLMVSRAARSQADARYRRIREIVDSGQMDAAVTEALSNPVIADLRSKFLEASKRYSEISGRLGPSHSAAVRFENEMNEYRRVIFNELGRIAESYRSDLEIARSQEKALLAELQTLVVEKASANEVLVNLRELEREAETYKNLYQSFLERYQEVVQQQTFPINEARIITSASPPRIPSHPRKKLILAIGLLLGGLAGVGIGGIREFRDRGLRTGEQVRERIGVEFLGLLPFLRGAKPEPGKNPVEQDSGRRVIRVPDPTMRVVLDHPYSGYTETLRAAKIAADLRLSDKRSRIIGTVSVIAREGKSTVTKNLASLLATTGARTLLIDCDLRNPGLTQALSPDAKSGLLEVLLEEVPFQSLMLAEPDSGLVFLPAVVNQRVSHTSELLSSAAMRRLLTVAAEAFDYVILDLPPLAPIVDVRAVAAHVDAFLFVVEWGKTTRASIRTALDNDPRVREKCLGIVLNKVDTSRQKMYETYPANIYRPDMDQNP